MRSPPCHLRSSRRCWPTSGALLSGRHHLALAAADGLDRAFGFAQPLAVASALLRLATPGQSGATLIAELEASETATGDRIRRLLAARPPLGVGRSTMAGPASLSLLGVPALLLLTPALLLANNPYCPA